MWNWMWNWMWNRGRMWNCMAFIRVTQFTGEELKRNNSTFGECFSGVQLGHAQRLDFKVISTACNFDWHCVVFLSLISYVKLNKQTDFICTTLPSHEIISRAGKTGQNSRRKWNQSWNLFIHISNKSASIKTKDIPIESSKLLCFSFILFYSKLC